MKIEILAAMWMDRKYIPYGLWIIGEIEKTVIYDREITNWI